MVYRCGSRPCWTPPVQIDPDEGEEEGGGGWLLYGENKPCRAEEQRPVTSVLQLQIFLPALIYSSGLTFRGNIHLLLGLLKHLVNVSLQPRTS